VNPNPRYRPNLERSIEVFGEIDEALVSRLAPKILSLRNGNADTITAYINSTGGELRCLRYIYDLIKEPSPDGHVPDLITVGIGNVGSAAAALLGLGDYSIAYPGAGIHFHGARYFDVPEITVESASKLANQLQESNQIMASNLAKGSCERLAFRYWMFTNSIEAGRKEKGKESTQTKTTSTISIDQFSHLIRENLSVPGVRIVRGAVKRWKSLREISDKVKKDLDPNLKPGIDFEAEILRRIITFEAEKNKQIGNTNWNVAQILPDFFLLKEYDTGSHHRFYERIVDRFGDAFFTAEEARSLRENKAAPENQKLFLSKVNETILPFCYFAASICSILHQQENPLSAEDAYWLGEVDEIYGSDLPCIRIIEEQAEQAEQRTANK
jgi:ATP-dependent protease ClpP protease subunit